MHRSNEGQIRSSMFQSVSCSSPPTRTRPCFCYRLHENIFPFPYINTGKSLLPSKIQDMFYKGQVSQCSLYPWSFGINHEVTKLSPYSFKKGLLSALITGVQHHDALTCAQLRELNSNHLGVTMTNDGHPGDHITSLVLGVVVGMWQDL